VQHTGTCELSVLQCWNYSKADLQRFRKKPGQGAFHNDVWMITLNRKAMIPLLRDNGKYILLIPKNYLIPKTTIRIKKEN